MAESYATMFNLSVCELAFTRERLMTKYQNGTITSEEMWMLNQIEDAVDKVIQQRKEAAKC